MAGGPLCGCGSPWIDDEQLSAVCLLPFEVTHDRRHRFRDVAAEEEDHVRLGNVRQREREAAIDAEPKAKAMLAKLRLNAGGPEPTVGEVPMKYSS